MYMSVFICAHVYVRQETYVLCMYVCGCLGSMCGSLALASGGGHKGVNKENEDILLFIGVSQLQIQGFQENA